MCVCVCVCRCPYSNVVYISNTMKRLFNRVRNKDTLFVFDDFNIYLFNCVGHSDTKQFIDLLYSLDLYPLIKRPSKIATTSVTLIGHI